MRKPAAFVTVLCCACTVPGGPQASAFVASPLRGNSNGDFSLARKGLSPSMTWKSPSDFRIEKDVVVIGGGLAGLSTALELAKRGRQVTVLSRSRAEAAAEAAGGMIAPQAERLESGVYLDLCLASRAVFAEWVSGIEAIAGRGREEARTHFLSSGGFFCPAFDGDAVHVWDPPPEAGHAQWVDRAQALKMEPSLSPDIVGAWWFPQDMSVDAQRMFRVLELACTNSGVEILQGTSASGFVHNSGGSSVDAVLLEDGRKFHAKAYVSATGAWMRELIPVPMLPHKGQMMALRQPDGLGRRRGSGIGAIGLTRVLFAEGCYIIPKKDGRIVVGSTVEVGEYGQHNTPAGIKQIIDAAVKVCPALGDLAIERTWAGLRPSTPDTMPVIGALPLCPNLFIAGGYWRNGVLLAPKAAQLVADVVCGCLPPQDEVFLRAFQVERFSSPGVRQNPVEAEPDVVPATMQAPQPPSAGAYSSGPSEAELLEMERAALEGANDGEMFSSFEGLGTQVTAMEEARGFGRENIQQGNLMVKQQPVEMDSSTPPSAPREAVNEYHASERFSESSLEEARLANRLVQEGSDARLEALFGDEPEDAHILNVNGVDMDVKAWEDGAEEVAKILEAQIVEVDFDVPQGMTAEEFAAEQGSIVKVFWENPSGEDIEVPRGMNIGTMVEAGMIPPVDEQDDVVESMGAEMPGKSIGHDTRTSPTPGVFDPSAVKGAKERSTELNELYAKVIANKASKVRDSSDGPPPPTAGQQGSRKNAPSSAPFNGFVTQESEDAPEHPRSDRRVEGTGEPYSVLGTFANWGDQGDEEKQALGGQEASDDGAHSGHGAVTPGTGTRTAGENKEMVGYDFILRDPNDPEDDTARSARTTARNAPEGEEAWAMYEDIAREAIASLSETYPEDNTPP